MRFLVALLRTGLFYVVAGFFMLVLVAPVANLYGLFCSKDNASKFLNWIGRCLALIFQVCVGVKVEYKGLYNLVKGPCIIASKHQSAYETFTIFTKFYPQAAYVVKDGYGAAFFYVYWLYRKYNGIIVKRSEGAKALIHLEKQALDLLGRGRQVVIFPEGTRVPFGEVSPFKRGVERIYEKSGVPVIPVALTTGAVMPKGSKLFYPGEVVIEFLPPIESGRPKQEFLSTLEATINQRTKQLEEATPCNLYLSEQGWCTSHLK